MAVHRVHDELRPLLVQAVFEELDALGERLDVVLLEHLLDALGGAALLVPLLHVLQVAVGFDGADASFGHDVPLDGRRDPRVGLDVLPPHGDLFEHGRGHDGDVELSVTEGEHLRSHLGVGLFARQHRHRLARDGQGFGFALALGDQLVAQDVRGRSLGDLLQLDELLPDDSDSVVRQVAAQHRPPVEHQGVRNHDEGTVDGTFLPAQGDGCCSGERLSNADVVRE